jgi:hypothetical protein
VAAGAFPASDTSIILLMNIYMHINKGNLHGSTSPELPALWAISIGAFVIELLSAFIIFIKYFPVDREFNVTKLDKCMGLILLVLAGITAHALGFIFVHSLFL